MVDSEHPPSIEEVKALRDLTGGGVIACRDALIEPCGSVDNAIELLRIKRAETPPIDFAACRVRWGRDCTCTWTSDGVLAEIIDGHGNVVPEEDWAEFLAYREASDEVWRRTLYEGHDNMRQATRHIRGYRLPWEREEAKA
jgi:hypothetical protein